MANDNASGYTVNEHGTITDLGKFEGEPMYAPYYWQQGLEGSWDEDENGVYFFVLGQTDYDMFPQLAGSYGLAIEESDQGFVSVTVFETRESYGQSLARMVHDGAEDDAENDGESQGE